MKKKLYILLLIILPLTVFAADRGGFIEQLLKYLKVYNEVYPEEKAYIQTDKTYYKPSEYIWYKAFLLGSNDNKPSNISDVIYIELRDPKGNTISKNEHNLIEGTCNGEFLLDEYMPGGIYTLIGYSMWMKNLGEEVLFKKEITVQKVITPRLLLKLDFEKRAYGPGDEVVALLSVSNLRNEKTEGSIVKSTVKIGGTTVQTITNQTENGEAKISFKLPDDLNTTDGILQILVAERGLEESIIRAIPIVLDKIQIQFLPEGGDLIENVSAKVAFEALNEFGKGADISGKVVDEAGETVASFESFHLGMGAFEFTPQSGKKYYAKIEKPQGNNELIALPTANQIGYSLNLKSKNEQSLEWSIYAYQDASVALVGQTQGEIYYAETVNLRKGMNTVSVQTNDFPIGIAVFTLFNELDKETCERLVFLNSEKGLNIKIESDKQQYKPKEEVKLTIKTTDKNGKPVSANLGLSVVDEQLLAFADDRQDNMLSYILFSSELKGKIQEPNFYFDETQPKAKDAIDYLMLTRGWRRFAWSDIYQPSKTYIESAEKISSIYGYVSDIINNPKQAYVYLIEEGSRKKIAKLQTTPQGYFVFHNVDISGNVLVTTLRPNIITLLKGAPQVDEKERYKDLLVELDNDRVKRVSTARNSISETIEIPEEYDGIGATNIMVAEREAYEVQDYIAYSYSEALGDEAMLLSDVVITGYGVSRKADITSAMSLVGKTSGVTIQTSSPGTSSQITIRGTSSYGSGNGEYMVVLDGILLSNPISANQSLLDLVSNNIESISIVKSSPQQYTGRATNGIIYINTRLPHFSKKGKSGYSYTGIAIPKRIFYKSSIYSQEIQNSDMLNSTAYWNANVKTNEKGVATLSFKNNDVSSSFRITAEGIAPINGLIGSETYKIATQKPFSLDVKLPLFASYNDTVQVPVMLKNNTDKPMQASVSISLPTEISAIGNTKQATTVAAQSSQVVYFTFSPKNFVGTHDITISGKTKDYDDEIKRPITIRSVYFPMEYSFSGKQLDKSQEFEIQNNVRGSIKAEVVCYTNFIDELFDGVESIFRQPYGCFEQASASTFPNIFALQLLNATGQGDDDTRQRALEYLEQGYAKLAAYEVKRTGGFEWYGGSPAHEVLSAYGLVEFYEMGKVYDHIDKEMMERTRNFILSRKDGSGGFMQNSGRYGFSGAPEKVNNAYIVYALTETENTSNINTEYATALAEAQKSKDMYRMALMASAAYNMKDMDSYNSLILEFKEFVAKNSNLNSISVYAEASIVRSYSDNLAKETAAFWLIALLKSDNVDMDFIGKCVQYISEGRRGGSFGSTQTTAICLQALTKYANITRNESLQGFLNIFNNNEQIAKIDLSTLTNNEGKVVYDISDYVKEGKNTVRIMYSNLQKPYPFTVNVYWEKETPASSELCPLLLSAKLQSNTVKRNETVRLSAVLKNTKSTGQPMSIAIIGIPGGLSLQPWQLKEMQEKGVFDFYEIINDNLVAYYRELGPNEEKRINLDLKAEIPGTYKGTASSTYLYYSDVYKHWLDGISVTITE